MNGVQMAGQVIKLKSDESYSGMAENAGAPAHEVIYQHLKESILYGDFKPGRIITLQGIADSLNVSLTPIRESVRRLIAERALEFHGNRRISVPEMSVARLDEIYLARLSLETELVGRAAAGATEGHIKFLKHLDAQLDMAIVEGDAFNYLKYNFLFHRELYSMAKSEILLPMVETLWLQLGPSLRVVCGRYGTSGLSDEHKHIISAISEGNIEAAQKAIRADILQGRSIINNELSLSK